MPSLFYKRNLISLKNVNNSIFTIDLIQKLTNQQGQEWRLLFHFRFGVIIHSDLFQQSKSELVSHTS
jgi:hypothetical protein